MPSLEEQFMLFTDRANDLDRKTPARQVEKLRTELADLDQARLAVPAGDHRTVLDTLSRVASSVLERRIRGRNHRALRPKRDEDR